jgi:IclR family acetate operon transcriptional repressor
MADVPAHAAVDRALTILECLGSHSAGVSLQEMSTITGIPKPSLHRTLSVMRARGFAVQDEPGSAYLLGPAALETAFSFHANLDLRQVLHPLVRDVSTHFGQTCHAATLTGGEITYVDKVERTGGLRLTSVIGGRNPAHATGVGKALLAEVLRDRDLVEEWVERHGPLEARTPNTVTTADALYRALSTVHKKGWAVDDEESEVGLLCVGVHVPLVFAEISPATGVSLTGLRAQMTEIGIERIGEYMLQRVTEFAYTSTGKSPE